MIYSEHIQIPVIGSPIVWTNPKEYTKYPQPIVYKGKILDNFPLQIRISSELYSDNTLNGVIRIDMRDQFYLIQSFYFTRKKLSDGYYYATTTIYPDSIERIVWFELYIGEELAADSLPVHLNPQYDSNLHTINYTNDKNDYNIIFNEILYGVIRLPIVSSNTSLYNCDLHTPNDITTLVSSFSATHGIIVIDVLDQDGVLIHRNIHADTEVLIYNDEIISTNGVYKIVVYEDDVLISESEYYSFTVVGVSDVISRTNTFKLFVEASFTPNEFEMFDSQEDYERQNNTNLLLYSMPYSKEKLMFGIPNGIPNWMYEKLSYVFACNNITVGLLEYIRAKGEKLEKTTILNNGLGIFSLYLQKDNDMSESDFETGKIFTDKFDNTYD